MSFISDVDDLATQLFVIEDLTPGYNHVKELKEISLEHEACRLDNFACPPENESNCIQLAHNVSTPELRQIPSTPTVSRRQSARIEAKQKDKKACRESEDETSEYCLKTKIPGGLTKKSNKLSPHLKTNSSTRKKRTRSRRTQSEDSSNCSVDSEENDPERLWCICRQPHDERFMICCDLCDEWYHGDCVGIKPEEGKRMEKNEIEFVCDSCKLMGAYTDKNDNVDNPQLQGFITGSDIVTTFTSAEFPPISTSISPTSGLTATIVNSLRLRLTEEAEKERDRLTVLPEADTALKYPSEDDSSISESFSTLTSTEDTPVTVVADENKVPSTIDSLQSVNLSSRSLLRRKKRPRITLKNETTEQVTPATNSCLGPNCDKIINPQVSLYCSNKCLKAYGIDVLQTIFKKHDSDPPDKSAHQHQLESRKTLVVLDRRSGTVLNGTRAPTSDSLVDFLSAHPTFQVVYDRQTNDRPRKSASLNQLNKCSGQIEASNAYKISSSDLDCSTFSSVSSESNNNNEQHQILSPESIGHIRKKYQRLLLALLEKRTQTSRHIFTVNRSRLKMLAVELESVISARNNLTDCPKTLKEDLSAPLAQDYSTYKCQLHLFLNCLNSHGLSEKSSSDTTEQQPSVGLRDQFFDLIISGLLKPGDLAHCQNVKTLESIVKRTRLADNAHNKLSSLNTTVSNNVVSSPESSSLAITCQPTESTLTTSSVTTSDEHLDTTSEHGKHLYDMHCKRCTGQIKMKHQQLLKITMSSTFNSTTTTVCSAPSVKIEPIVVCTSMEEKASFPNPVTSIQPKLSIVVPSILPIHETVKLSPKSVNDHTVLKQTEHVEDTTACLKKETNQLRCPTNQYNPKTKSNFKGPIHPSMSPCSSVSEPCQDNPVPLKSFSCSSHHHPPSSTVSTGLLDLPLPPSLHNSSLDSQSNDICNSYNPLLILKEKLNSTCCLWTGLLSLSTQYSGREHLFSLEINVYPFGYIQPKASCYYPNSDNNDDGNVIIQWDSLLLGKQTSLVVSRGVNLTSLPVYFGQTLLDSTHPRELFVLRVASRTKQMSHIYKDIFNHLKEINACGSLEPRFQDAYDCLLYPLVGSAHLRDILLPENLLSKFHITGCDTIGENQLLIILTKPIKVTPAVENYSSPLPPSSSSAPSILNSVQGVPVNMEETVVNAPSPLLNSALKSATTVISAQPSDEAFSAEINKSENITVEVSSINIPGDVDLRPFTTTQNLNHPYSTTQEWCRPLSSEDVDYRKLIPQPPIDSVQYAPQSISNHLSLLNNDDYKLIPHVSPEFHQKGSFSSNKLINTVEPTNYQPLDPARHLLPDPVKKRRSSGGSRFPLPFTTANSFTTNSPPITINIQRSNPCALLPTPSVQPLHHPSSSTLSSSRHRLSNRSSSLALRSLSPKKPPIVAHYYNHHKYRHSHYRR
ncbi:Death-inducer obliterator 1 [Schistosoma japonicum]|nr:Death-inducer obliterator 1 [Schistosoma japonicum]